MNYGGSASVNFNQTVTAAPTTTVLTSNPTYWPLNEPTVLTAVVTANAPSTATPTGSVVFTIDGIAQTAIPLDANGKASKTYTFTLVGGVAPGNSHSVLVDYTPGSNFSAGPGPQASRTFDVRLRTDMTLGTSLPDGALENEAITFYAFVTGAVSPPTPTGGVNFFDNGVLIGTGILNPTTGIATLTLSGGLSIGNHSITAEYVGDGTFNPVAPTTALSQMVVRTRIKGRLIF
jgi:hypothetical protein